MKSIVIHLSKKWDIWPRYGHADRDRMTAYVREDLPLPVKMYIEAHETYHVQDPKPRWREIRAGLYPVILIPVGFLMVVGMTLFSRDRLEMYLNKIRGKG